MTLSFLLNGLFVRFVPSAYLPRKGRSKVRYFRDTFRTLQALVEVITYYNPLKMVLLLCSLPLLLAAGSFLVFLSGADRYYLTMSSPRSTRRCCFSSSGSCWTFCG